MAGVLLPPPQCPSRPVPEGLGKQQVQCTTVAGWLPVPGILPQCSPIFIILHLTVRVLQGGAGTAAWHWVSTDTFKPGFQGEVVAVFPPGILGMPPSLNTAWSSPTRVPD